MAEIRPSDEEHALVSLTGMHKSISDEKIKALGQLVKTGSQEQIIDAAVAMMTEAAESHVSNGLISKNISIIILPSDTSKQGEMRYIDTRRVVTSFSPGVIVATTEKGMYVMQGIKTRGFGGFMLGPGLDKYSDRRKDQN